MGHAWPTEAAEHQQPHKNLEPPAVILDRLPLPIGSKQAAWGQSTMSDRTPGLHGRWLHLPSATLGAWRPGASRPVLPVSGREPATHHRPPPGCLRHTSHRHNVRGSHTQFPSITMHSILHRHLPYALHRPAGTVPAGREPPGNNGVRWHSRGQNYGTNCVQQAQDCFGQQATNRLKPAEILGILHVVLLRNKIQSATIR